MAVITTPVEVDNGRIGYKNLFVETGVTVTVSDEDALYPKENAYDWLSYDWWKQSAFGTSWLRASFASAKTANYMAIFGHNLSDVGGSIKPQYSTDAGVSWNDAASVISPINNNTIFVYFADISAADWRVLITTTTGVSAIAGVMIGESLLIQRGFVSGFISPRLALESKIKTYKSEKGVFIGGTKVREGFSSSLSLQNLTPDWVYAYWIDLMDHLRYPKPIVFSWDPIKHPDDAVFAYAKDGNVPAPSRTSYTTMSASLNLEGVL